MPTKIFLLSLLASGAAAQEPPMVTTPPPWAPYYVAPGPSPEQINALEQHGRRKKRIGAILMGSGGAIALAGTALWIAGDWDQHCGDGHDPHHHQCGSSSLSIAGATTLLLGTAAIIPGIVLYVGGGSDVDHARRLKRQFWGPVSLSPTLSPGGAGVRLQLAH